MGWSWTIFEGIPYWNVGIYLAVWDYISSYSLPRLRWGMFLGLFFFCLAVCMLGRQARLHCLLRQVLLLISGTKVKSQLWVLTSFCIWSGKCLLFFFFFFKQVQNVRAPQFNPKYVARTSLRGCAVAAHLRRAESNLWITALYEIKRIKFSV